MIVNLSRLRCDPLVVTTRGTEIVPLPEVTLQAIEARSESCAAAIGMLSSESATLSSRRSARLTIHDFACHGVLDLAQPSSSGLCLYDGVLTVAEIADLRLQSAELALLSACHTAAGDTQLPDEAIHPAAAFQLAGFRHVIATSWPVSDIAATELASRFYHELTLSGQLAADSVASALRNAIRAIRDNDPGAVTSWAAYLHTGP